MWGVPAPRQAVGSLKELLDKGVETLNMKKEIKQHGEKS